ncbi:AGAP003804-PA-like protein [Anopheles sinensis]|uniref:AGAP003804-PA-like protein n=1 Tax=Anopheles sinensis TaxID=74873 RepID=A0A084VBQ1_ANOSI|nr:AGAP003804-PA-like protein [Anopheles sinensis]
MDLDNIKFTFASNGPIGFNSSRTGDTSERQPLQDFGTDPMPSPGCADVSTQPRERKEMATQTISAPHSKKYATYDDSKLVSFIRKVQPIMEEELSYGITPVFDFNDNLYEPSDRYRVCRHQELTLRRLDPAPGPCKDVQKPFTAGAATWLSVLTRDAPLLAVACSVNHEAWCEHFTSVVTIFSPQRNRYGGSVQWTELCSNPVKACIESLDTNPFNRDMFAGGTVSGDVYIWQYDHGVRNERNSFTELHSETTDCGKVVDMAWARYNVMSKSDSALLTAHSEGTVILWRVGKTVVKDKIFKLSIPSASGGRATILTQILATSNTEFVAGCADGSLLLCSTTQLIPLGMTVGSVASAAGKVNHFSPGTIELKSHSFAVTSLQKVDRNRRQELLISCDLTGEVFFHDITDTINSSPTLIIKMPLPFKTRIVCSNDTEFIFSPTGSGLLELYRIGTGKVDTVEPSLPLKGTPNLIKMTANGKWLITGTYNGTFIIYSVTTEY